MAVRSWLQKNQVFDRDLVILFPQYGVNNPETDLKELTPQCWNELKLRLMTDRAAALKDSAARNRMQKKLTKVEKLWKSARTPPKSPRKKKNKKDLFSISTDREKPKKERKKSTDREKPKKPPKLTVTPQTSATSPIYNIVTTIETPKKVRKKSTVKKPKNNESKQEENQNNKELKHKYATLESHYKLKCDEFDKINKKFIKLTDLQSKYDALQEKNKALKKDCKALKQKEEQLSQYKQSVNTNDTANDQRIQSLQTEYKIKCEELDKINSQIHKQAVKINDLQFKYDAVMEKNKTLKKDCKTLKGKEDEFEEYKSKITRNNNKENINDKQIKLLRSKIDEKSGIINLLQAENERLDEKIKAMQGNNEKYKEQIDAVNDELHDVKNANLDKILKFEAEIENLLERNDKLKKSMKDITKNRRHVRKDESKKYEELYHEFEEFKEIMESEQNAFEDNEILLNDEITQIKLINNKKNTEIKKLHNKINILKSDLEKKEAECDELQCRYDEECENNEKPLDVDKIIAENKSDKLRVQNKALDSKYKKKAQQYSSLLKEYNEYLEQQNEEQENMQNSIDALREDLKKINDKYANKEHEYKKLEKEHEIMLKKVRTNMNNKKNQHRKKLPKNYLLKLQAKSSKESRHSDDLEEYYEEYGDMGTPTSPASMGDIVDIIIDDDESESNDTDGRRKSRKRKFKPNKKKQRSNSGTRLKPKPRSKSPNISQSKSKYASDIGINSDSIDDSV